MLEEDPGVVDLMSPVAKRALLTKIPDVAPNARRRSRILDIKTLEEDPGAAQEFARSKAAARKEGLTGVEFKDIAGLDPILGEVLEVRCSCYSTRN
jgi:hypothetical protein